MLSLRHGFSAAQLAQMLPTEPFPAGASAYKRREAQDSQVAAIHGASNECSLDSSDRIAWPDIYARRPECLHSPPLVEVSGCFHRIVLEVELTFVYPSI